MNYIDIEQLKTVLNDYSLRVVAALVTLIIGRITAGIIRSIICEAMKKAKADEMLISFTSSVSYIALMAFVVISALGRLGLETTSFIAILGAAGLAIGLALQGSLANFASGVLMIIFKPFKVGDFIEAGGTAGIVEEITIFNTVMKTPDNRKIIVPNSSVTGGNITNNSANPIRRIDLTIGVGYGDDLDKVKSVLEDILKKETRMLAEPEFFIGISELADSSVNFAVRPWVNSAYWWPTRCDLMETIKKRFDDEGISIPYPQQDVHMHHAELA